MDLHKSNLLQAYVAGLKALVYVAVVPTPRLPKRSFANSKVQFLAARSGSTLVPYVSFRHFSTWHESQIVSQISSARANASLVVNPRPNIWLYGLGKQTSDHFRHPKILTGSDGEFGSDPASYTKGGGFHPLKKEISEIKQFYSDISALDWWINYSNQHIIYYTHRYCKYFRIGISLIIPDY